MSAQAYALNVATREYLPDSAKKLVNTFSQSTPLITKLRPKARKYPGGTQIRETVRFRPSRGGGHKKGAPFRNVQYGTAQPIMFDIKDFYIPIVVDKFELGVLNNGPDMIFDRLDEVMTGAFETAGQMTEIALYFPGTGNSYAQNINGLAEICNDGVTNSWNGATYANYGELSRTDGSLWNNAVRGRVTDVNAAISFSRLNSTYTAVKYGTDMPDIGLSTERFVSYVADKFQTQQRFVETLEPTIGFTGLKFQKATLMATRYCPGSEISASSATTGDPVAYEWIYTTTIDEPTPATVYPTVTGETLFWLNTSDDVIHMYISSNPVWQLGFEDFIPDTETDELVGRLRLAWQIACPQTRKLHQVTRILA
jgi:hypothetical protein